MSGLTLSRLPDEKIMIGDEIIITIISIKGKKCRVNIQAPVGMSVHREEVYNRLQGNEADVVKFEKNNAWDEREGSR